MRALRLRRARALRDAMPQGSRPGSRSGRPLAIRRPSRSPPGDPSPQPGWTSARYSPIRSHRRSTSADRSSVPVRRYARGISPPAGPPASATRIRPSTASREEVKASSSTNPGSSGGRAAGGPSCSSTRRGVPVSRSIVPRRRNGRWAIRPRRCASSNRRRPSNAQPTAFIDSRSPRPPTASTAFARRWSSTAGMSISTGQTS